MEFVLFLVRIGHITPEQAIEVLGRHVASRPSLGKLALDKRTMSVGQVFDVLKVQANDHRLFGEVASALGFLDDESVHELLCEQLERTRTVDDVLVGDGYLSDEQVRATRMAFHRSSMH